MKKLTALILTIALLLSVACVSALADESKSWPVMELKGSAAELTTLEGDKNFRRQAFSGPGTNYSLAGAYLPRKVTVQALLSENGFTLIDVEYNGGRRCVYVQDKYVVSADVEKVEVTPVKARTKASINPMYYGPGNQYDVVRQRMKSKYADMSMAELEKIFNGDQKKIKKALQDVFPSVELVGGSRVNVLYEVNGWVCVESEGTVLGRARTWIPADQVTPD